MCEIVLITVRIQCGHIFRIISHRNIHASASRRDDSHRVIAFSISCHCLDFRADVRKVVLRGLQEEVFDVGAIGERWLFTESSAVVPVMEKRAREGNIGSEKR